MDQQFAPLFEDLRRGHVHPELDANFPFYPLCSPGMPLPGEDFIRAAVQLGDPPPGTDGTGLSKRLVSHGHNLEYLYRRALYDEHFALRVMVRGTEKLAEFVPGHLLGDATADGNGGPRQARIMLIGKNPGRDEVQIRRNFVGPTSSVFFDALIELGVRDTDWSAWYATNLVKWPLLDDQSDGVPIAHKKDCEILLEQEIRLVRPDYILCLGSDASKALLGTAYGVNAMVGRVLEYTVGLQLPGETPTQHTAKVMAVTHPAQVYRRPEMFDDFKTQLALFLSLTNGAEIGGRETFIQHENVYHVRRLRQIVDEIRTDPNPARRVLSVDGEWQGDHPADPGAYLRTVQFSSRHGEAVTVVLRHQGGAPAFQPSQSHAIAELVRLLKADPAAGWFPRVGGHFFRADLPWLIHNGLDLRPEYMPPDTPAGCKTEGGWDTSLMYHAVNEATSYGLTDVMVRLTSAPVYDAKLKEEITGYCKQHKLKKEDLEGFGMLPDWILHPYASYDADVTRRIAVRLMESNGLLDNDWFGNASWEPYWIAHRASLGFLEMEMTGLLIDKERVDSLSKLYVEVQARLLQAFRAAIRWPLFNPASTQHVSAFLFGDEYTNKRDPKTKQRMAVLPAGAVSLHLTPLKTTGKRSKLWADIVARGETAQYTPSTDRESLGILGHASPLAMQLRDLKFIAQTLRGSLRPPTFGEDGEMLVDDEGGLIYEKGLAAAACADGRVHTHLQQVKETGRASSSRPPVQNISKRREGDYSRILGTWVKDKTTGEQRYHGDYQHIFPTPQYQHPIRTLFRAAPGHVLVEADFTGAELAVIAWSSGDAAMIEHVRRNMLPENDPQHYDIHAQAAVRVFHLDCAPTKKGMKEAGISPLRVAAKNVNFGVPYGRSAEAIARQCREEGVDVTEAQCQQIIDGYFEQYPGTAAFLANCRERSQNERWMVGPFGRYRRFIATRDRSVKGEQERQSQNFPIQNGVADAVSVAVWNFTAYRWEDPSVEYRQSLQIHDALLFEVPIPHLRRFKYDERDAAGSIVRPSVLRTCMIDRVPVIPRTLDNRPLPVAVPYHFGSDVEVFVNWGEELTDARAIELGIDPVLL